MLTSASATPINPTSTKRPFDNNLTETKISFNKCFTEFIKFSNSIKKETALRAIAPHISQGTMTLERFIDETFEEYFRDKFKDESLASNFRTIIKNFINKKKEVINKYSQTLDAQQTYKNFIGELFQSRNQIQFDKEWRALTIEPRKSQRHFESNASGSAATLTTPAPIGSSDSTPISAGGPSSSHDVPDTKGIINALINALWVFRIPSQSKPNFKPFPLIGMEFRDHNSEKLLIFKFSNNGHIDEHSIKYDMPFGQSQADCQKITFKQVLRHDTVNLSHPNEANLVFKSQSEFESQLNKLNELSNDELTNLFDEIQKTIQQAAPSNSQESRSQEPQAEQQYPKVTLKLAYPSGGINPPKPPKRARKTEQSSSQRINRVCQTAPSTQPNLPILIWTQLSQLTGVYQAFKHRLSNEQNETYDALLNQLQGEATNFQLNINTSEYDKLKLKIRKILIQLEVDILMIKDVQLKLAGHKISDKIYANAKSQNHQFSPSRDPEFERLSQLKDEVKFVEMITIDALEKKIHGLFLKNETNKLRILLNDCYDNDLLNKFKDIFPHLHSKGTCKQALSALCSKYFNPKSPLAEPSDSPNETHKTTFFELNEPLKNLLYTNALVSFCKTELIPDALVKIFGYGKDQLLASPFGQSLVNALSYVIITKFPDGYLNRLNDQQLIDEKVDCFFKGLAIIDLLDIKKPALAATDRTIKPAVVSSPGIGQTRSLSADDFIKLPDFNSKIIKIKDRLAAMHSGSTLATFQQSNALTKLAIPESENQNSLHILNILYQILIDKNEPMDSTSIAEIKKSLYLTIAKEILNDETDTDCEALNVCHTRTINLIFDQVKFTVAVPASSSAPIQQLVQAAPIVAQSATPFPHFIAPPVAASSTETNASIITPQVVASSAALTAPNIAPIAASSAAGSSSSAATASSSSGSSLIPIPAVQPTTIQQPVQAVPIFVQTTVSAASIIASVQAVPIAASAAVPQAVASSATLNAPSIAPVASSSAAGGELNDLFSRQELEALLNGAGDFTNPSQPVNDFTPIKRLESSETLMLPFMIQASLIAHSRNESPFLVRNCATLLIKNHDNPQQKFIGEGLIAEADKSRISFYTDYINDYMQRRQSITDPFPIEIITRAIEQNALRGHSYYPYLPITDQSSNVLCWTLDFYHMFDNSNVKKVIRLAPNFLVISNDEHSRFLEQIEKHKRDTTLMSGLLKTTEPLAMTTTMAQTSKYYGLIKEDIGPGPIDGALTVQPKKMESPSDHRKFNFSLYPIPASSLEDLIGKELHNSLTTFTKNTPYSVSAWYGLNPQIRKLYKRYKKSTKDERPKQKKLMLFHGTSESSVPEIFENNFNSIKTQNEVFGHGVYGAEKVESTIFYAHRKETPNDPKLPTAAKPQYGPANYPDQFSVVVVKLIGPSDGFKEYATDTSDSKKSLIEQIGQGQWGKTIKNIDISVFLTTGSTDVAWMPVAVLRFTKQK